KGNWQSRKSSKALLKKTKAKQLQPRKPSPLLSQKEKNRLKYSKKTTNNSPFLIKTSQKKQVPNPQHTF
ncbi:hypothetical protein ACJBUB_11035, partial [Streptococcus suis]